MVGFRTLNALPFQTGNTRTYNTFSGTGFRPLDSQLSVNYITTGPLSDFDTSIFEDYAPTYIPIPQHYYDPSKGIYEHDGKEIIDDTLTLEGPSFEDKSLGKGNYITATDILGPPPKEDYGHPGVSDTQKSSGNDNKDDGGGFGSAGTTGGAGSGDSGDVSRGSWSTGGQIPPMYAVAGDAIPTYEDLVFQQKLAADLEQKRKEEEAATAGTKSTGSPSTDLINFGSGMYDLASSLFGVDKIKEDPTKAGTIGITSYGLNEILGNSYFDPASFVVSKGVGSIYDYIFNKPEEFTGYPDQIGIEDISGYGPEADGYTSNKDYDQSAFDFSPFNVDPNTGQVMTAQSDTIPGDYSPPSVNISVYDTANPYIDSLKTAFADFNIEFEAEQEAKRQAAIDAAKEAAAAAAAANNNTGGFDTSMGGYTVSDGHGGSYNTDSSGTSGYSDPGGVVGMSDYE
jgi:hypothetical protein